MFFLKLLSSIVKVLHSQDSPEQVAWGFALGAIPGLTPLWSLHNLLVFLIVLIVKVNAGAALLSLALFSLLRWILSPVFHLIGNAILTQIPFLTGLWTALYNAPLAPLTRFNNTVVMGGFVTALVLIAPNYFIFRVLVVQYRKRWGQKIEDWKIVKLFRGSRIVQFYMKLKNLGE